MKWSDQQKPVFKWFREGVDHLVLIARAGTGKTTVCLEGIRHAPKEAKILLCAFSKVIAVELQERLAAGADSHPNAQAVFSSVHKAKGLEWPKVFILADTLREGQDQEEDNIAYVAITRAQKELAWVRSTATESTNQKENP